MKKSARELRQGIVDYWRNASGEKMTRAELDALIAGVLRKLDTLREVRRGKRAVRSIRVKRRRVPAHYVAGHYRNIALRRSA